MKKLPAFVVMVLMVIGISFVPGAHFACIHTAWAADAATSQPATSPVGEAISGFLSSVVFPVMAAFLLGLLSILVRKVSQKYNLKILAENEELIEKYALQGITYAEEQAAKRIAASMNRLTGQEKLDLAIANIVRNIPAVPPEKAKVIVESMLARIEGVGASKETALAVR